MSTYEKGTWAWACQQLVEGNKVRRSSWEYGYYWYTDTVVVRRNDNSDAIVWFGNLTATDWKIFDETPTDIKESIAKLEGAGYKVIKE